MVLKKEIKNKPVKVSENDVLFFGRYKGKKVSELVEENPGYLLWASDQKIIKLTKDIREFLEEEYECTEYPEDLFWDKD